MGGKVRSNLITTICISDSKKSPSILLEVLALALASRAAPNFRKSPIALQRSVCNVFEICEHRFARTHSEALALWPRPPLSRHLRDCSPQSVLLIDCRHVLIFS